MITPADIAEEVLKDFGIQEHQVNWERAALRSAVIKDRKEHLERTIKVAASLASYRGENEEYDRALVETIAYAFDIYGLVEADDKRAYVEARLKAERILYEADSYYDE